jgi:hypothetical protein
MVRTLALTGSWKRHVAALAPGTDRAPKITCGRRNPGRLRTMRIVRMALENPRWGYTRIQGALLNVGHEVGRATIAHVLRYEGAWGNSWQRLWLTWK